MKPSAFKEEVWAYYRENRRDFPWRNTRNPYHILVSEIMLQQTQAPRVEGFYSKFLTTFPRLNDLASAPISDVLRLWRGLGYNRRAIMLKRAAQAVVSNFEGHIPASRSELEKLPGVGPATAGAVLAYAFGIPSSFIETNIRRVFIHSFFPNHKTVSDDELMPLIEKTLDVENPRDWYYALMDYGSFLGKTISNPNKRSASYHRQSIFKGSRREARGKIIHIVLEKPAIRISPLAKLIGRSEEETREILEDLSSEGLIQVFQGLVRSAV